MANQAFSDAKDLMVGAGELYFKRFDDTNGLHTFGNAEEMNLTTDVTTIEKNSSMNHRRDLMDSSDVGIKVTATATLDEYNPFNMALAMYGPESVHVQAAKTVVDEQYSVIDVPHIIELKDADGSRYFNVSDVSVSLASSTATPAKFTFGTNGVFTDTLGGTLEVTGSYAGDKDTTYYIKIETAPTGAGDLEGMTLSFKEGMLGTPETFTCSAGTTGSFVLGTSGLTLKVSLPANTDNFTVTGNMLDLVCTKEVVVSNLKNGKDYFVDEQSLSSGLIKIMATGNIKKGDTVKVSYTVPEAKYCTVAGAASTNITGELLFVGDPSHGGKYNIQAWKCKVTPDGDLSGLITEKEYGTFKLKFEFLADYINHPDYPIYKVTKVGEGNNNNNLNGIYDPNN